MSGHRRRSVKTPGPMRKLRAGMRRVMRRHPQLAGWMSAAACALIALALLLTGIGALRSRTPKAPVSETLEVPVVQEARTQAPLMTGAPATIAPEATAPQGESESGEVWAAFASCATENPWLSTPAPEGPAWQTARAGSEDADPAANHLIASTTIYQGEKAVETYAAARSVCMGDASTYAQVEGITTFRGTHYRDTAAWGTIPEEPQALNVVWRKAVGKNAGWKGVGWTGQASCVRWPEETRARMNLSAEKRAKDGLIELIYATLDGRIYFLDMEDGDETREAIDVGAPIKGSVSVDPRGYPLLYSGQGIYEINGRKVACGMRIFSLIDQSLLYFLDGNDSCALRTWRAFDASAAIDGATDTMVTVGENGILYLVRLNVRLTEDSVSIAPRVVRYVYEQAQPGKLGSENSVALYNHYAYFATNIGIIQCVDLNTMQLVWCVDGLDDIDASLAIEIEADGAVALYGVNELDKRGSTGTCQMFRLDALTGDVVWMRQSDAIEQHDENGGGGFATPALGKKSLEKMVYYQVARTAETGGVLYALDKSTGEPLWTYDLGSYGWSSPVCVYAPSGKGYLLVGSSNGMLRLFDGLTGRVIQAVDLEGTIEGSPVVFDDLVVVGTRAGEIIGIRIS